MGIFRGARQQGWSEANTPPDRIKTKDTRLTDGIASRAGKKDKREKWETG
jgi:hypothetical protein